MFTMTAATEIVVDCHGPLTDVRIALAIGVEHEQGFAAILSRIYRPSRVVELLRDADLAIINIPATGVSTTTCGAIRPIHARATHLNDGTFRTCKLHKARSRPYPTGTGVAMDIRSSCVKIYACERHEAGAGSRRLPTGSASRDYQNHAERCGDARTVKHARFLRVGHCFRSRRETPCR
jgi:hypothetical protein